VLALTTSARVVVWQDERRVWTEATERSPLKPRPWINLGVQYERVGATAAARVCYERALVVSQAVARSADERDRGVRIARANLTRLSLEWDTWIRGSS
jgi:hypothetical protein